MDGVTVLVRLAVPGLVPRAGGARDEEFGDVRALLLARLEEVSHRMGIQPRRREHAASQKQKTSHAR